MYECFTIQAVKNTGVNQTSQMQADLYQSSLHIIKTTGFLMGLDTVEKTRYGVYLMITKG